MPLLLACHVPACLCLLPFPAASICLPLVCLLPPATSCPCPASCLLPGSCQLAACSCLLPHASCLLLATLAAFCSPLTDLPPAYLLRPVPASSCQFAFSCQPTTPFCLVLPARLSLPICSACRLLPASQPPLSACPLQPPTVDNTVGLNN